MAFVVKDSRRTGPVSGKGQSLLQQHTHVARATASLPASTTGQLFRVRGGRVRVHLLIGQVTTIMEATDAVMKVSSKALSAADVAIGTSVDIASTLDTSSWEAGSLLVVEGDGTALVKSNAGAAFLGASGEVGPWIAPQGEIYLTTTATKTGSIKWDIFYQPLDEGAWVEAVVTATVAI